MANDIWTDWLILCDYMQDNMDLDASTLVQGDPTEIVNLEGSRSRSGSGSRFGSRSRSWSGSRSRSGSWSWSWSRSRSRSWSGSWSWSGSGARSWSGSGSRSGSN
jgi:hypothetical protein